MINYTVTLTGEKISEQTLEFGQKVNTMSIFGPQVPLLSYKPHGYVDMTVETKSIPSFADVLWVFEDEGESFAKTRYGHK